jgi:hypothetical protein
MNKYKKPNSFTSAFSSKSPFKQDDKKSEIDDFFTMGQTMSDAKQTNTAIVDPSKYYTAKVGGDKDQNEIEDSTETNVITNPKGDKAKDKLNKRNISLNMFEKD